VDFIFSNGMLDIIIFDLFWPAVVEMMDFARNFSAVI